MPNRAVRAARTFAGCLVLAALSSVSGRAEAVSCLSFQGVYPPEPEEGAPEPEERGDSPYLWQVCHDDIGCEPLTLTDPDGTIQELDEVDRWALVNSGPAYQARTVVRYRAPGVDALEDAADADGAPPSIPHVRQIVSRYSPGPNLVGTDTAFVDFEFDPVDDVGFLVADIGAPDPDPLRNLVAFWSSRAAADFEAWSLGLGECDANFADAAPGVATQVRFGLVDLAGRFSGWSETYSVAFDDSNGLRGVFLFPPELDGEPVSVEEPEPPLLDGPYAGNAGGCALAGGAAAGGREGVAGLIALAGLAAVYARRRRSAGR